MGTIEKPSRLTFIQCANRAVQYTLLACLFASLLEVCLSLWRYTGSQTLLDWVHFAIRSGALYLFFGVVLVAPVFFLVVWSNKQRSSHKPPPLPPGSGWKLFYAASAFLVACGILTVLNLGIETRNFQNTLLRSAITAISSVLVVLCLVPGFQLLRRFFHKASVWFPKRRLYPLRHLGAALLLGGILLVSFRAIADGIIPVESGAAPWEILFSLYGLLCGLFVARWLRSSFSQTRIGPLSATAVLYLLAVCLVGLFVIFSAHSQQAKGIAISSSPFLQMMDNGVRAIHDWDRDGYGSWLGGNDCAPRNPHVYPGAPEIPDNGIDENCDGKDFRMADFRKYANATTVPSEFNKDWNVLLVSIDTVRFDRTGFGGYPRQSLGRNLTPNLDRLAAASSNFINAQTSAPGTMAALPSLHTSQFFHSGIAIDDKKTPPVLLDDNFMMAEMFKQSGYDTGAIVAHYYFNQWGFEQGFETFDNSIGTKNDPWKVTSPELVERALAWINGRHSKKWFLWLHLIDPHGRYVNHPMKTFGDSEYDKYDSELFFTDHWFGKLHERIKQLPNAERTIIVVTSDHGDSFDEHGHKCCHGHSLYQELTHVPLIISIPGLPPRKIRQAVSTIDIFPTLANLIGYPYKPGQFQGESLVPQMFFGKEDKERTVFIETNVDGKQRAAVSRDFKLIYRMKKNLYEFYDLNKDPKEKRNLAPKNTAAFKKMKERLDQWLSQVFYSPDERFSQVRGELSRIIAKTPPQNMTPAGITFHDGAIHLLGYELGTPTAKNKLPVTLVFRAQKPISDSVRFELFCQSEDEKFSRRRSRYPAEGIYPTNRWVPNQVILDSFTIDLPPPENPSSFLHCAIGGKLAGKSVNGEGTPFSIDNKYLEIGKIPVSR